LNNFPPDVFSVAEQPCHEQVSVSFMLVLWLWLWAMGATQVQVRIEKIQ